MTALTVTAVDHLVFNVRDVEKSADWYMSSLGMKRVDRRSETGEVRTTVAFGEMKINLRPVDASPEDWFTGTSPVSGSQDLCFLTDVAPAEVVRHFEERGVDIEAGPVVKSGARGPIRSVYVRDPDGNLIEVSSYG